MKVTVTFELNCCRDCVFCGNGAYEESCCYHPTINYRSYGKGYLEDVGKIPEWCPLIKKEEIKNEV